MNRQEITEALHLALEIEGLLLLLERREADSPEAVGTLLADKSQRLVEMLGTRSAAETQEVAEAAEFEEEEDACPEPAPELEEASGKAPSSPAEQPTMRLEDKLAGNASRDLRKALTINDRYLFCRELFDMSNNVLNRTLDAIGGMASYEEAERYVTETLELDPQNPSAQYFLNFIARHFK